MPSFPIIDAHIHLFDRSKVRYDWMATEWPEIDRPHLMADLDSARGSIAIDKVVICEVRPDPGQHMAEVRFIESLAAEEPRVAAMTAWAPLDKGEAAEPDIAELAAVPIVRGVRFHIPRDADDAFDDRLVAAVKLLGRHGLHYEIGGPPRGLAYALKIARRCPEVPVVLVHMGGPDIPAGEQEPWRIGIVQLAATDNIVSVKVSGTVSFAGKAWRAEDVKPYLDHVLSSFGTARCMYGSDWPASSFAHAYGDWTDLTDEALAGASSDERQQFYRGTAERTFRLY